MSECEKCKAALSYASEGITKLYGERFVVLCVRCKNAWHEKARGSYLWPGVVRVDAKRRHHVLLANSGQQVELHDIGRQIEQEQEVKDAFYRLSGEWLADGGGG